MKYEEKKFNLGQIAGISEKTMTEHLKLYSGYVKHTNLILEKSADLLKNPDTAYSGAEMQRRFGFEFNGMKNHELYFSLLSDGAKDLPENSALKSALEKQWGSYENWLENFKKMAGTRGPGWVILYYDKQNDTLLNSWVDEQHSGILGGLTPIIALDMWEHAFYLDYITADKGKYVEAYFTNLNWLVAEEIFLSAK